MAAAGAGSVAARHSVEPLLAKLPAPRAALPAGIKALYVDLDGVLADFNRGVVDVCGREPDSMTPGEMWGRLRSVRRPGFFGTLEPMPDAAELWEFVERYQPTILSGLPMGAWAPPQKQFWVQSVLGKRVPLITCMAREKVRWAKPGAILIDDNGDRKGEWEKAGGRFILHTSAEATIRELQALGFK